MRTLTFLWSVFAGSVLLCSAELRVAALFSDGMVLQRNQPAPVWGWADPGETVYVSFAGQKKTAVANEHGKWHVELDPMPAASNPEELVVWSSVGNHKSKISNVLVGDVWLCSGQSNMGVGMGKMLSVKQDQAAADCPEIRMFKTDFELSLEPQDACSGAWTVCSSQTVGSFSAVAYYFGRELFDELDVPIGLLLSCRGGTGIETWSSYKSLLQFPEVKAAEKRLAAKKDGLSQKGRAWRVCPGVLYNTMIYPLVPYGMRGLVWYQGESNAHSVEEATLYRDLLENMIGQWRNAWGADFAVYAVQLPNYQTPEKDGESWPFMRESVLKVTQNVPGVQMAVTIDVGDPEDLHPKVKRPVGERLARQALVHTYGKTLVSGGPNYRSMIRDGFRIILQFDSIGSGLIAKGGPLKTFEISGVDGIFVPAEAEIVGDTVVVGSDAVKNPMVVRYAWAPNPAGCNLYNREGFPASPFRTND